MKQDSLFNSERKTQNAQHSGPVECLGMTFENDEARREHFLGLLREGLEELHAKLGGMPFTTVEDAVERMKSVEIWPMGDETRLRELAERMRYADSRKDLLQRWKDEVGFPYGEIEDILNLSDPPYYTACPNPFIAEFIKHNSKPYDPNAIYAKKPFSGEMRASQRHPVYSFHPYHTKVPPDVIKRLIEHYTSRGDLVFDGFCGTGMTGVAARECGRNAIIGDLCPIATFIAGVNTKSHDWHNAIETLQEILEQSEKRWGYLYESRENGHPIRVNYFVWSDVFTCPECVFEFPFFPHGVIHHGNKVETRKSFQCPFCAAELNVRRVERVLVYEGKKKALVWVNAGTGRNRINRAPNEFDIELAKQIEQLNIRTWFPTDPVDPTRYSAKLAQLGDKAITDISRFLSTRNRIVFSDLWDRVSRIANTEIRNLCKATLTSIFTVISERQGYFGGGGGMSGNLYMPIVRMEKNIFDTLSRKLKKLENAERQKEQLVSICVTTTQSTTEIHTIPDNSVDYIYTDPPFGANIIYSEMNLILEGWLRIKTNEGPEAVIDETRQRTFDDYSLLMRSCFRECYRILKPGRWMTVEFHNTQASVWNLIQNAIGETGFVIAQVDVFDKGSTTILADIRPGAAKQDLIISAYKPNGGLEERFKLTAGTEEGVWDFIRTHLKQLPVFIEKDGKAEVIAERQNYLLFDRMVAFHVQRGVTVPLSAAEFYAGLTQRFPERDGMYFLPEQVAEYDKKRMKVKEVLQLQLFVTDEASAIQWLKQQLTRKPQTFQELHPQFLKEIGGWQKHEKPLELSELLEQNFLRYDGKGEVPSQIHSYLSSNFKELRNLPKDDEHLRAKAKDRWYVPDPNKAGDLEKLRERALLREFEEYRESKQKRLKVFRLEAVRAGFKKAWQERDYATIIAVARKIPDNVLQEDPKLLMWYDQALTRMGE